MLTEDALAWERGEEVAFTPDATLPDSTTPGATYAHLVGHVVLFSDCGTRRVFVWPNEATARNGWQTHAGTMFSALR